MEDRQKNSGRRTFLSGAGAALSAVLAPAAAAAGGQPDSSDDAAAIRQLYRDFAAGLAQPESERGSAPSAQHGDSTVQLRLMQDPAQPPEAITVAADRRSATARFHCLAQCARPLAGDSTLVVMARLQGQHSETWWETGIHELDCVHTAAGWKIRKVVYRPAAPAGVGL